MNEEKKYVMTEEEILAAPEADYMNQSQTSFFENRLFFERELGVQQTLLEKVE